MDIDCFGRGVMYLDASFYLSIPIVYSHCTVDHSFLSYSQSIGFYHKYFPSVILKVVLIQVWKIG